MGSLTAVPGDQTVTLDWPAARTCHLPVAGWDVVGQPGNLVLHLPAGATTATFNGLQNGISYNFTVTARNADGQDSLTTDAVIGDWRASYDVSKVPTTWAIGHPQTFPVTVTNIGKTAWPSTGFTAVELDLHFASYPGGSDMIPIGFEQGCQHPSDVAPGQKVTVN